MHTHNSPTKIALATYTGFISDEQGTSQFWLCLDTLQKPHKQSFSPQEKTKHIGIMLVGLVLEFLHICLRRFHIETSKMALHSKIAQTQGSTDILIEWILQPSAYYSGNPII